MKNIKLFNEFKLNESRNDGRNIADISLEDTKKIAEELAKFISEDEGLVATVNPRIEVASFDLDLEGDGPEFGEYAGGSYNLYDDGTIINHAISGAYAGNWKTGEYVSMNQ